MINVSENAYKGIVKKVGKAKMAKIERDSIKASAQETVPVQAKRKTNTLEQNTAKIVELHDGICDMLVRSLDNALQIGELLFKQKEIVKRDGGLFTKWAADHLPFSIRTAQRYMKLFLYVDELKKNDIETLTDAYAHINGEPITDEIVDADDSLKTSDLRVVASVDLDTLDLPKKKAKGLVRKFHLTQANIDGFIEGDFYKDCQGRFAKIVLDMRRGNALNYRMGEFLATAEKYLKPGGKVIFHKL